MPSLPKKSLTRCGTLPAVSWFASFVWALVGALIVSAADSEGVDGGSTTEPTNSEPAIREAEITEFDRSHWAWRPLEAGNVPEVNDTLWCRSVIDRFVLSEIESAGGSPALEASSAELIRRLTLNLTGLPPTAEQIDAFKNDKRIDAYERLVDRLLAQSDYGRHQAQAWLDLARYAETDGFEHDKTRPNAWKYRDWVIDALNDDQGYDRFVRLQIAGDVLDPAQAVATAFCLSGPDMPDINLQEERRDFVLNDITSTVGAVFLALQTGCAQCHDHKYDPLSQLDFYRLRSVFEPDVQVTKDKTVDELIANHAVTESSRIMIRGDWRRPGPTVLAAFPRIANATGERVPVDATGAERRIALANWLTNVEHPLTARVAVNRIWQQHFGRGLSDTPNDFGFMGNEPNPAGLLDYLAVEFMKHGWNRKWLDRQIALSATFRQSSQPASPARKSSSWDHYPRRRMTGEQVRDAMLFVSDNLSSIVGGKSVMPPLPTEMLSTIRDDHWSQSPSAEQHHRRSIYVFARRNLRFPTFDVFDRPAGLASCAVRNDSTTAIQSLTMLNSSFSQEMANRIVERAIQESSSASAAVEAIVRQVTPHSTAALAEVLAFAQAQRLADLTPQDSRSLLQDIAVSLLNSNDFLYID